MTAKNFELTRYCERIGYDGPLENDLKTLNALHRAQLFRIPFENLDVASGKIVDLTPERIVEKLIDEKRGGYCYEVNGLLAMALSALGFEYRMCAARPRYNYTTLRPKTHMVLAVKVSGEWWLADTGFGGYGLRAPLRIKDTNEVLQDYEPMRLRTLNENEYLLQTKREEGWIDLYSFDLEPQLWVDYILPNYFNSTSPDTIFTQVRLTAGAWPNKRMFILDKTLKEITKEGVHEHTLASETEYSDALKTHFGIEKPKDLPPLF